MGYIIDEDSDTRQRELKARTVSRKVTKRELIEMLRSMDEAYGKLHDKLSDMIEGGRLRALDIPDDYIWLAEQLAGPCNEAAARCEEVLKRA